MSVTIVIAAHDAEPTLGEALDSLLAQTHQDWEAIVVDDGSTDGTAAVATRYAERDPRIRMWRQQQRGKGAARNAGIASARSEWLLFLDADDWLLPHALDRLTSALAADPALDAVYGGWTRVAPRGEVVAQNYRPEPGRLFEVLTRFCAFTIHACLVRRALVERVGAFDPSLHTCEDWDLWQRVARAGARFSAVAEIVACYRMRPDSASLDAARMLADGLRTITLGHGPDPRVPDADPLYAAGMPRDRLAGARLTFACWVAGLLLGRGDDPRGVFVPLAGDRDPTLSPHDVASSIFTATLLPGCQLPSDWVDLWPRLEASLDGFLETLERQSGTDGLRVAARRALESLVLDHARGKLPSTIGRTHAMAIDVTEPLHEVRLREDTERLRCFVDVAGDAVGVVELPVCDGLVPARVLADAVAADFAWQILERVFARTIYPALQMRQEADRTAVWRGALRLAEDIGADENARGAKLHAAAGWVVFLQELWGRPTWGLTPFYDERAAAADIGTLAERTVDGRSASLEVSDDLVDLVLAQAGDWPNAARGRGEPLDVELTVAGIPVTGLTIPAEEGRIGGPRLLARLTEAGGFEVCRIAVREAIIGLPVGDGATLRQRLAKAARARRAPGQPPRPPRGDMTPGWADAVGRARADGAGALVLGRHAGPTGTSVSRLAALPSETAPELRDAAAAAGEMVIELNGDRPRGPVIYAPDLLSFGAQAPERSGDGSDDEGRASPPYDRHHFEWLFAERHDPWDYDSAYERVKYEQTLSLLTAGVLSRTRRALEIGCAEGRFTTLLAPHVPALVAADISDIALRRTAARCARHANVELVRLDLMRDRLPGRFELIVCSEVLYYAGCERGLAAVGHKLAAALAPGGYLLAAHANCVVDDPKGPGFDWDVPFGARRIGEMLGSVPALRLDRELRTDLYRVQLFQRLSGPARWLRAVRTAVPPAVETRAHASPPPEVAAHFLPHGGIVRKTVPPRAVTERLPILMYHRVAPDGTAATARYRVTPEAFEAQLRYLQEAGFRSVRLDAWRRAGQRHEPLAGRCVVLTFDDGDADFGEHAAPLLARCGFTATVFVVSERVGRLNTWDSGLGEHVRLLDWPDIARLYAAGIEFGSHSATHPRLTTLSPAGIVREAARSRALLARRLGTRVSSFAYPFGAEDRAVQHLVGACGYVYGLTCRPGPANLWDPLLALPRIEILGSDTLEDFIRKLG